MNSSRLERIDALHALGVGEYISLPQLVVVDDQSSGKSSVLEGLTGLPFPRDSGLCTRFPTQIVFQRAQRNDIRASIIPVPKTEEARRNKLESFHRTGLQSMDETQFANLMKEASATMDIKSNDTLGNDLVNCCFSFDILRIELLGPDREHFSVVDLPGLFRKSTPGLTTKEDIVLVKEMIMQYIQNSRSLIMVVVPANVDIATQEIIQMALDADNTRQRTLGVLTKPDLVDEGAEKRILDLIIQSPQSVELGYSIVCNRSQKDLHTMIGERNAREKEFFKTEPWSRLPPSLVGIVALRERLNGLLVGVAEREFPAVSVELNKQRLSSERALEKLGPARSEVHEQRNYLLETATKFQAIAADAVDGYYSRDHCFIDNPDFRLATILAECNEGFLSNMQDYGATWLSAVFSVETKAADSEKAGKEKHDNKSTSSPLDSDMKEGIQVFKDLFGLKYITTYPELGLVTEYGRVRTSEKEGILDWIKEMYRSTQPCYILCGSSRQKTGKL